TSSPTTSPATRHQLAGRANTCRREVGRAPLICVGDPRKGGSLGHFFVVWPRFGPCLPAVDRSRGRGGAPAAQRARTNDFEVGEDPPHTWSGRGKPKTVWFKSFTTSRERCGRCAGCARRRAALSGSTDDGPAI